MKIESLKKSQCTGCMACYNTCAAEAITMKCDKEGFWYPGINKDKCVSCKQCDSVCPALKKEKKQLDKEVLDVYAINSKDNCIRFESTSGGLFSELAIGVLEQGGSVAGATYYNHFRAKHILIDKMEDLEKIRQSKYEQSYTDTVFQDIRHLLKEGKKILFCGTPCQCAGLKLFLKKDYENLYLCDFICRGVNSQKVFQDYLKMLEERFGAPTEKVWMKYKKYGWHHFNTYILFKNGRKYRRDCDHDPWVMSTRYFNLFLRPSCYECQYKDYYSVADLTVGDFWGLTDCKLDDDGGTSICIVNTKKGEKLLSRIEKRIEKQKQNIKTAEAGNVCLKTAVEHVSRRKRKKFFKDLEDKGFQYAYENAKGDKRG